MLESATTALGQELRDASDDVIADAVLYADPMVLCGVSISSPAMRRSLGSSSTEFGLASLRFRRRKGGGHRVFAQAGGGIPCSST